MPKPHPWDIVELWRPVPGWPYEASSWGRVRRTVTGRILRPYRNPRFGYMSVKLSRAGRTKGFTIYQLVCLAFHGPKPTPRHEVAHWDGSKTNDRATNLRWATKKENEQDKLRHGTSRLGKRYVDYSLRY